MKKWVWITSVAVIIIIAIFFISISNNNEQSNTSEEKQKINDKGEMPKTFTSSMLKRANDAFSKGINIEDKENDWYLPAEGTMQWDKPDNPKPYPFGWTDFKNVSLGADEEYIYVRFVFYDKFPNKMPSYNGDDIFSTGAKIADMYFINSNGKSDSAEMGIGVGWVRFTGDEKTSGYYAMDQADLGQLAMISPNGTDEHSETIYAKMEGAGYVAGGAGYNYLLSAFPLSNFGISLGDEVNLTISTETGSNKWHHESIDNILDVPGSKSGGVIVWKLGENSYKIEAPRF